MAKGRRHQVRRDVHKVVRDQTFTRAVADQITIMNLGRDLELGCIQFGTTITSIEDMGDQESVNHSKEITEVVRLRVSWPVATTFAMNLLYRGIAEDIVKGDAVIKSLTEWVAEFEKKMPTESGDD